VSDTEDHSSVIINKDAFHALLEQVIAGYYEELRLGNDRSFECLLEEKLTLSVELKVVITRALPSNSFKPRSLRGSA
jgi:hypothetical protein